MIYRIKDGREGLTKPHKEEPIADRLADIPVQEEVEGYEEEGKSGSVVATTFSGEKMP